MAEKGKAGGPIGYVRVSTEAQAAEGVSLDAQRDRIAAWCSARGVTFDPADLHVDAGISGKRSDNRPGVRAAIEEACRRRGVLIVYSLSRLARSTKDAIAIAERLDAAGAQLVSLTEQIDTTTAMGRMFFRMMAVLAEFERELIVERTTFGMKHKRAAGERISRHIPYGDDLHPDGKTLIANIEEREIIILMHRMNRASDLGGNGLTTRQIARELNARGIRSKTGGDWSHSSVRDILKRTG